MDYHVGGFISMEILILDDAIGGMLDIAGFCHSVL